MRIRFRLSDLIPVELNVEAVHYGANAVVVAAYGPIAEAQVGCDDDAGVLIKLAQQMEEPCTA